MKDKEPIYIEEPYTCTVCGRKNLKFKEIGWREDKEGQIDLTSVKCGKCSWVSLWPTVKDMITDGHNEGREKEVETLLKKEIRSFEHNYNRRLITRAIKKKE